MITSKKSVVRVVRVLLLLISAAAIIPAAAYSGSFDNLPVKGEVTMIDLGAKKCIPCKMMAPILEKMEKQYKGKAVIAFIDVFENRDQAQRFRISAIPTQIFYDKEKTEVYRHVGFMSEEEITAQLKKMGIDSKVEKEK